MEKPETLAIAFYNRGRAYYELYNDFDRAIAVLTKAIQLNPEYVEAIYRRGLIYKTRGIFDRAIADFNEVIGLDPTHAEALYERGSAYKAMGEHEGRATGGSGRRTHLDEALDKLIAGNIAFNAPEHARIGTPQIVEAKLAVNVPPEILIAQLTEAGKRISTTIEVADRMSAKLDGGGAFDISPPGPQQQLISHKRTTSWAWEVTAKQAGTQYLILSFDAILTVDGKDGMWRINTFKRQIEVEVASPETPSEWFTWFKAWFENISWLWATVLVPIGLWIWNRFWKKPLPVGSDKHDGSSEV